MSPEWDQSTWSPLFKMLVKSYDSFSTLVKNGGCPHIVFKVLPEQVVFPRTIPIRIRSFKLTFCHIFLTKSNFFHFFLFNKADQHKTTFSVITSDSKPENSRSKF